ncbi:MAG TPA: BamA/TamA family outer membrane protein [Anaeromyxobacteraceae bacterium]
MRLGLLAALALAAPAAAPAQGYDPRFTWRTVDTPRFRVHFHGELEPLALRAARAAERAHAALAPIIGHRPEGPVDLVLSDDTDDANGSATVVPRNVVRLYAVPPASGSELSDYGDWMESLVFHEYTHILHLDTVEGLPRLLNAALGKVFAPAGLGPPWLTEGLAVLHESGPGAGRIDAALFEGWTRALVADGLPGLEVVSSAPLEWPRAHLWYLLGGRFLAFIRERCGDEALRAFVRDQGSQIWPYLNDTLAERHLGRSFLDLWADFGAHLRLRYGESLAAAGRAPEAARQLTRRGALLAHPRFDPDGRSVVYAEQGLDERPGLRRAGLDGRDRGRLAEVEANQSFALLGGGRAVVAASDVHEEYAVLDDLFLVDLGDGSRRRLTSGERATDPDAVPGGSAVVYVAHLPGGRHALRRRRLDGGAAETLLERPGAELFLPRVAPDGRRVALEIQEGGRRDVAVWDRGALGFVTDDDALDQAPAWSPDGRTLYFSSDRGGVFDLYAFELGAEPEEGGAAAGPPGPSSVRPRLPGRLRRLTATWAGAYQPAPSPDGRTLAFLGYSSAGYDVMAMPLDPASWGDAPDPAPRPAHRLDPRPPGGPLGSRPYRPLDTLGPAWWLPFLGGDGAGWTAGAVTGGADVALRHSWALAAAWGGDSRQASYDAAYAAGWMHPLLSLASSRSVGTTPESPQRLESQWAPLDAAFTFTRAHLDRLHALSLGWRSLVYRPLGEQPAWPPEPAPPPGAALLPPYRGAKAGEVSLGLAYGSARRFARSVSGEEGGVVALRLRLASPDLGGDQTYATARLSAATYLRLPLTRHAVLALHGSLGASSGTFARRLPFSLGGVAPPDVAAIAAGALGGGFPTLADELRGYPSGAFAGSSLAAGTAELRFPLLAPQLGHSAWPLLLRRLHGALFLDAGGAFRARDGAAGRRLGDAESLRFGAGVELRLEVVLGYYLRTDVRLGVARGLGQLLASPRPPDPLAETQVYFTIGESF